jgi:hypothetical protein
MKSDSPSAPSLADLLRRAQGRALMDLRTCLVAEVVRWRPDIQAVDVQPLVRHVEDVAEEEAPSDYPVVTRVPVQFPRWGGFVLRMPLAEGDKVLLLVSDRELTRWLQSDGGRVTPGRRRTHHLDDAVALPGISTWAAPVPGLEDGDLVLGREDGAGEVRIKPSGEVWITSGGDAPQPMVLGQTLVDVLSALTVPTAFGPSGTPLNAPQFADILAGVGRVK